MVEEVLLNKTVQRFSNGVLTQSLKGVIVENDDYLQIFTAIKKLSKFAAHDEAAGKQGQLPTIKQLKGFVEEIENYRKAVVKRRNTLQEVRKKLEEPPKADFA